MAAESVTCAVSGPVAEVRLDRPERRNALTVEMLESLVGHAESLKSAGGVRAIVLSGQGKGFCSGIDLAVLSASARSERRRLLHRSGDLVTNLAQQAVYVWTQLPQPVIAAVHGFAIGAGLQLALGADLRIVAPDARLSLPEVGMGLVPDMTGTQTLARLVPPDIAKELVWTGREVSGERAVAIGLATRTSTEPRKEAMALAYQLAERRPEAVARAKALLDLAGRVPLGHGFLAEEAAVRGLHR